MTQDFVIDQTIYTSKKSTVYKARRKNDDTPLILKVAESNPDVSGLQNEINILRQFYPSQQAPDFVQYKERPALVRGFVPGISLREILNEGQFGEALFRKVAMPIIGKLNQLHDKGIIHKDISPGNIIFDATTGQAEIIDFEIGSLTQQVHSPQYIHAGAEGNLFYISPEQTGRMNRALDYRSDYYSLGIVFYEVLTGSLPFQNRDALELIHCHIAQLPENIHHLNPEVPLVLAAIVDKLSAKQAEERYQSLAGLLADLEIYFSGSYPDEESEFVPGCFDLPFRLRVSQKFVGREKEKRVLHDLFQKAIIGDSCFLEIAGFSGVGKTTLVKECLKDVTRFKGLYISGKFEKGKATTPYYGWISAFNELSAVLQAESPERKSRFKQGFEEYVGALGGVVTSLCPQLELFYGKQTPIPPLSAKELQNRFFIAINQLFLSLTAEGLPLVVFIDDWQWADDDSINLLLNLISDKTLRHCLIVSALRDNEVSAVHPYRIALDDLHSHYAGDLAFVNLSPLTEKHCESLVRDTLRRTIQPVEKLVEVTFKKTQGNPFFLNSFFENLYYKKLLFIDPKEQMWDWNLESIAQLHVSEELADMVVDKLRLLDTQCFELLQKASFFGNRFKLGSLAALEFKGMGEIHRALWPAIQNCLVLPVSNDYKFIPEYYEQQEVDLEFYFAHDKVQQACYSAFGDTGRSQMHYRIGEILYNQGFTEDFDTAVHFLTGLEIAEKQADRDKLFQLFLQVGYKAFQQSAMETGHNYYRIANSIKPITDLRHFTTWIECAFIGAEKAVAMKVAQRALHHFEGSPEKFEVYEALIRSLETISENQTATEVSRKALSELGFNLPRKAATLRVAFKAIQAKIVLNDKKIKQLTSFPEISDPHQLALVRILNVSLGPFFLADEKTYPFIIFKMIMVGSKYGNCPEITAGYSSFALTLSGILNAWQSGYLLGVEALKLVEKYQTYKNIAVCGFAFTGFVQHRKDPVKELPGRFLHFHKKGMQYGEIIYGNWNLNFAHLYRLLLGQAPLAELRETFKDIVKFNRQYKNQFDDRDLLSLEFIKSLSGSGESDFMDFSSTVAHWEKTSNPTMNFTWHMLKGMQNWVYGHFEQALADFEKCLPLENKMVGSFIAQYYLPFVAVLNLHQYHRGNGQKKRFKKIYKKCRKKLEKQQRFYAYNVNWMVLWLDAEEEALRTGNPRKELFEKVQAEAHEAGFVLPALLVRLHHLRQLAPDDRDFQFVLTGCLNTMRNLGMDPAIKLYEQKWDGLRATEGRSETASDKSLYTTEIIPDVDLMTLLKAADAITGELNLEKLLYNMLSYIMQNTGARFGCLLLWHEEGFTPRLALKAETGNILKEVSAHGRISDLVIHQVGHTREPLILDQANKVKPYTNDAPIVGHQVKSLFCLPLLHQAKLIGMVYLTNELMDSVFNASRIGLTKLLAGQMAISVENAMLYEDMEKLVEKRTAQLEREKQKSDELLLNILPEEVAYELKEKGRATPRRYDPVTVLFTDFEGFTTHSEKLSPEALVTEIDKCYRAFDEIISHHNIEKIKTIGDAYMAVCGLPEPDPNHATKTVQAALEIMTYMQAYRSQGGIFRLRIGIHTGSVIAGIVGSKKFAYDIWGDTVNTAARMEQSSLAQKINISQTTYDLVKGQFSCEYRGELQVKHKGVMPMYFIHTHQAGPPGVSQFN